MMVRDSYEASTRVRASLAAGLASPRLRPGRASRTRRAPIGTSTRTRTHTAPAPHPHLYPLRPAAAQASATTLTLTPTLTLTLTGERDVPVSEVFTPAMWAELKALMTTQGWGGVHSMQT